MLCDAFLYWVKAHPRLTIDFVEIRASYLNEEIVGDGRRLRYSDVIRIPFNYVDLSSYASIGNTLVAFLIQAEEHVNDCTSFGQMLKQHAQCFQALNPFKYGIEP